MRLRIPWRSLALVSTTALVTLTVHAAIASGAQPATVKAQGVSAVTVVTDGEYQTLTAALNVWTDIPGATAAMTVPSRWHSALIAVRFSGDFSGGGTTMRVLVDGVEANPVSVYKTTIGVVPQIAVDRSLVVGAGSHTVEVQWETSGGSLVETSWSLTVEAARVS